MHFIQGTCSSKCRPTWVAFNIARRKWSGEQNINWPTRRRLMRSIPHFTHIILHRGQWASTLLTQAAVMTFIDRRSTNRSLMMAKRMRIISQQRKQNNPLAQVSWGEQKGLKETHQRRRMIKSWEGCLPSIDINNCVILPPRCYWMKEVLRRRKRNKCSLWYGEDTKRSSESLTECYL